MKFDISILTDQEKSHYSSLANALGIGLKDLLQLEFYNQDIFDAGGIATQVKYLFVENNPPDILKKIKGLEADNTIILSTKNLNYY